MIMQLTIPTTDEIRDAVRAELSSFFADYQFQPKQENDEIGGIELAVEITGKAKPTIYALTAERKIPHSKRGKRLYFSRKDLTDWLKSGKRKTQAEIELEAENFSPKKSQQQTTVAAY